MPEPMTEQELAIYDDDSMYCGDYGARNIAKRLIDEVRRLRELHADALRQIKLIQEQAQLEVRRRAQ